MPYAGAHTYEPDDGASVCERVDLEPMSDPLFALTELLFFEFDRARQRAHRARHRLQTELGR
jgi:hypothetical protein